MDAAEDRARQQERQIEQSLGQQWPNAPHMEVLQATQALRSLVARGGVPGMPGAQPDADAQNDGAGGGAQNASAAGGGASGGQNNAGGGAANTTGGATQSGGSAGATSGGASGGSHSGGGGPAAAGAGAQNIDQLAREVYDLLKIRLRAEMVRQSFVFSKRNWMHRY